MSMIVKQQFRFEAAHHLPLHPGKCFHPHGHSYRLEVGLDTPVNPETGMTIDFEQIESVVRSEILALCDHKDLNDLMQNPTAENVIVWVWERLEGHLPGLSWLELWETDSCSVAYRGPGASPAPEAGSGR
jgi:6-pyruvoyltetrahydropterin/6-carboxytetrahydropterin synthase